MTHTSSRAPVLVGVGTALDAGDDAEAVELMVRAVTAAGDDCGVPAVLRAVQQVAVPRGTWSYTDPGRIIRDRLFFFGAINPSWQTRTFIAPDDIENFPLRSLGEVDRDRRTVSYSAKATYQPANAHRVDVSLFGDPSKGEMGPQRTSSLTVQDTSSFSELTFGGHNQTVLAVYNGEVDFGTTFYSVPLNPEGAPVFTYDEYLSGAITSLEQYEVPAESIPNCAPN